MIRGGDIDICILGAKQVSPAGDLVNWSTGAPDSVPVVGGAMDLVAGVRRIHVITQHCTGTGEPKLVEKCSYALTGLAVVDWIYTDLAVIDIGPEGLNLVELAPGVSFEYIRERTEGNLVDIGGRKARRTQ